jgi:hypothetical protein
VRISPATVCREAGHSRNALYENHKELLAEIRKARPVPSAQPPSERDSLRDELEQLRAARQQLISENAALLYRVQIAEKGRAKAEQRLAEMERLRPVPIRRPVDK